MSKKPTPQGPFTEMATRAAVTGGVGLLGSLVMGDQFSRSVNVGPLALPAPVAVGAAVAASSVAADISRNYVLPWIPGNEKFATMEGTALGLGVAGVSSALLMGSTGSAQPFLYRAAVGAGSYAAGDYIHSKLFTTESRLTLF